ncbi:hypothetical protein FACS189415_4490 [Bacteroidia bacterium]|nr:hypothetical protein FACS189415_4490 [Bacteroidia bacterium]
MELEEHSISTGDTKEDKKQRKQFIKDYYKLWGSMNPNKQVFNKSLKENINVKSLVSTKKK